jgi:hypothetical protein
MPRSNPPPPAIAPAVQPFSLSETDKRGIARVLTLPHLPQEVVAMTEEAVAAYKATAAGSPDATVGNTLAALAELSKKGRAYGRAVARLADDRSGVDYTTLGILQPLARAVLAGAPDARDALARAAIGRAEELRQHKRVDTRTEALRFFCGVLRLIFNRVAPLALRGTMEESWHHCRAFAMEVLTLTGIDHADFDAHPERLTEYLGTDVSID